MRLYQDPISTTSRPVLHFLAEHELEVERVHVDLLAGEQRGEAYRAFAPNAQVPVLVDGDLVLPECAAILKYLADAAGSATYPEERKARARVDAMMDWINTGLVRDFGYGFVYPAAFPMHRYADPQVQEAVRARAWTNSERWLAVLDAELADQAHLCGDELSIADYLGASHFMLASLIDFDFSPWPNIAAWLERMQRRPSWDEVYAAFYALRAALRQKAGQAG